MVSPNCVSNESVGSKPVGRFVGLTCLLCTGGLVFAAGQPVELDYTRDLRLDVAWHSTPAVLANPHLAPPVTVRITNTSRTYAYEVIQAGGGSERGAIEPRMRWSLERHDAGKGWYRWDSGARAVRADALGVDWRSQVVALKPGEVLDLKTSDLFFNTVLSSSPPGTYRARATYVFGASDETPPASLVGVPPYTLTSNPVVFTYAPPFAIELDEVRSWAPDKTAELGALVSARLVNRSQEVLKVPRMLDTQRTVIVHRFPHPRKGDLQVEWPTPESGEAAAALQQNFVELKPGESVALFGPDGVCNDADFRLTWVGTNERIERIPPTGIVVRLKVFPDSAPLSVSSMPLDILLLR